MGFPRQEYWSWLPFPSPRDFSWPRDWTRVSGIGKWILHHWTTWEAQYTQLGISYTQSNVCPYGISRKVETLEFMKIKNNSIYLKTCHDEANSSVNRIFLELIGILFYRTVITTPDFFTWQWLLSGLKDVKVKGQDFWKPTIYVQREIELKVKCCSWKKISLLIFCPLKCCHLMSF